ncbi:MAG: DUF438 domain-containing protein [Prolixibacteraceae bacterium]|nr:DUF438 domain-containing protein [Prolixibacteraceae bacterium]
MSEFTQHKKDRLIKLSELFKIIIEGGNVKRWIDLNKDLINLVLPSDIIILVDELVQSDIEMQKLKKGISKLLNILYIKISDFTVEPPEKGSFLWVLQKNNLLLVQKLNQLKPLIKKINKSNEVKDRRVIQTQLEELGSINGLFIIKENILFPIIEKHLAEFRCISVLWSIHDDVRKNLKRIKELMDADSFELSEFNRLAGDIFFDISTLKFREEKILYPYISELIPEKELNIRLPEALEMGFPFYQPGSIKTGLQSRDTGNERIDLGTGSLTVEQVKLLFNHLPVEVTYVDETDKVRYFSTPAKRVFPRTAAIIGRDVHNCHPKESVHVVKQIVNAFRKGEKDHASFWIDIKNEKILIQYFAIRDENCNYMGVIEVTQEIDSIQKLSGEKRILEWQD